MKSYIQPFERRLALEELRVIATSEPRHLGLFPETSTEFELESQLSGVELAKRLAYWESVHSSSGSIVTTQSLRESTVQAIRNGITLEKIRDELPYRDVVPLPNRRCLRYGTHGIHEYRGKFFPQLVRSLINVSGTATNGVVADPMCGSGTAIVEAILAQCRGVGLDMNPLSVYLARVKCKLLSAKPSELEDGYKQICAKLAKPPRRTSQRLPYFETLPAEDRDYLANWFSNEVLAELDVVSDGIAEIRDDATRDLMRISLSNILRSVSWQKEDDLRVRKEIRANEEVDVKRTFLEDLGRSTRAVLAFLYQNGPICGRLYDLREADARQCGDLWAEESVDVIITSPPYATALPYLDTDRLSLSYLGLLPRPQHRSRDQFMIGNREVTEKSRRQYWERFEREGRTLPRPVQDLIWKIEELNSRGNVGFRRRNLGALLSKYFFDMVEVIRSFYRLLKPRSFAFVVVGNNHTIAGGERVEIETATMLQHIARQTGFHVPDSLPMEMLVSRDIFRKNSTVSEEILAFYKRS